MILGPTLWYLMIKNFNNSAMISSKADEVEFIQFKSKVDQVYCSKTDAKKIWNNFDDYCRVERFNLLNKNIEELKELIRNSLHDIYRN